MTLVTVGTEPVIHDQHHQPAATPPPPGAYTCPMHPEIVRDQPGRCPICGMHLEPVMPSADDDSDLIAYRAMGRRFWISVPLSALAVLSISMLHSPPLPDGVGPWVELLLATPAVVWCAGPFFVWFGAVRTASQPEHVDLDRPRCEGRVHVLSGGDRGSRDLPGLAEDGRAGAGLLRSGCHHLHPDPAGPGAGAAGSRHHWQRDQGPARPRPATARRIEADGSEVDVDLAEIVVGDRVRVRPGEKVPVDGTRRDRNSRPWTRRC